MKRCGQCSLQKLRVDGVLNQDLHVAGEGRQIAGRLANLLDDLHLGGIADRYEALLQHGLVLFGHVKDDGDDLVVEENAALRYHESDEGAQK